MQYFLTTLAVAAGLVDASAVPRQQAVTNYIDTYDALPTTSEVGLLHDLQYAGATVRVRRLPNGTQPIVPHSKPNFAESGSGSASFDSPILISAGPDIIAFDLNRFYFACITVPVTGNTEGPAQACSIEVNGLGDGTRHYSATFDYNPSSPNQAPFAVAQFNYPNFRSIQNLTIGLVKGSAPAGRTSVAIDSLDHLNYN